MEVNAWKIRSGGKGQDVSSAFWDKKVAAIGWGLGDLSGVTNREEIKDKLRAKYPDWGNRTLGNVAGSLHRFANEIQVGDLILTPPTGNRDFLIGQCQSPYKYLPGLLPEGYEDVREVNWLRRIRRSDLSGGLRSSCNGEITVSSISEHIDEIKSLLGAATSVPGDARWDDFIGWAKRFYEWEDFGRRERDYKLEVGKNLAAVKQALLDDDPEWEGQLITTLRSPIANYLVYWGTNDTFLKTDRIQKENALRRIWGLDESASLEAQVEGFYELAPFGTPGEIASFLLMANDATQHPMYRYTPLKKAYQLLGYQASPNDSANPWERYEHALGFFDKLIEEASSRGLHIRDRLDAQSLAWCVTQYAKQDLPADWSEDVKDKFIGYRDGTEPPPPTPSQPRDDLVALADNVYLPASFLEEIVTLLRDKKQVIFQGPPGTGKTYVAKELANHLAGSKERVTLVQFHPSYAYEDFVQGFRPALVGGGQPGFELRDGPLLRAAKGAREEPHADHYLVIDEINRGNLAKVFGELYFLLEYRDEKMRLQYQKDDDQDFSLPANLYVIGTMNTADRSIALVDLALRRRFYFVEFHPDDEPVKGALRRWLEANELEHMDWVADVVDQANEMLKADRHAAIGPSYFMKDGLDDAAVERIWKHSVLPYIEERRFGGDEASEDFSLDRLRKQVESGDSQGDQGGDGDNGDNNASQNDDTSDARD